MTMESGESTSAATARRRNLPAVMQGQSGLQASSTSSRMDSPGSVSPVRLANNRTTMFRGELVKANGKRAIGSLRPILGKELDENEPNHRSALAGDQCGRRPVEEECAQSSTRAEDEFRPHGEVVFRRHYVNDVSPRSVPAAEGIEERGSSPEADGSRIAPPRFSPANVTQETKTPDRNLPSTNGTRINSPCEMAAGTKDYDAVNEPQAKRGIAMDPPLEGEQTGG